jgi:hypothetical protein
MAKWKLVVIDMGTGKLFWLIIIFTKNNVDIYNSTNDILIPSLMCYHTCYVGTIIDSFNTAL